MSLRDVRARFEQGESPVSSSGVSGEGAWKVETDPTPTMTYVNERGALKNATFEFHSGMLVAATVLVDASDPRAKGPPFTVTETSITAREHQGSLVRVRVIARDCPGHQEEVRRLLGESQK